MVLEGTWFSIFLFDFSNYILPFLATFLIFSLASLPICYLIFDNISDRGTAVSGFLGLILISFFVFIVETFTNSYFLYPASLRLLLILWTCINIYVYAKKDIDLASIKHPLFQNIIIFVLLFFSMYFILARNPGIYQIERFMDYGFIKAIESTKALPLEDLWFSRYTLNYYYFSHLMGYVFVSIAGIDPTQGFYLLTALLFAITGTVIFRIAYEMLIPTTLSTKKAAFYKGLSGIIGILLFCYSGTFYPVKWFINNLSNGKYFPNENSFWYADVTRSIKGTITEVPFFSYLEANIHPHVYGYLVTTTVLLVLLSVYKQSNNKNKFTKLYLLFFLLGVAFITNTWDIVPLALITALILFFKFRKHMAILKEYQTWTLPLITLLTFTPWYATISSPVNSLELIKQASNLVDWFYYWGPLIALTLVGAVVVDKQIQKTNGSFIYVLIIQAVVLLAFSEIYYFKDILSEGEWYRANTFFKLVGHIWISLTITGSVLIVKAIEKFKSTVLVAVLIILATLIYPYKTWQYFIKSKTFTGLANPLSWLEQKYPDDYNALSYLQSAQKPMRIVEASGESYEDNNYFSTYLGATSIVGWPVHEWTWRGSYTKIGERRAEVSEIYTGSDIAKAQKLLKYYSIDYIIVGNAEQRIYKDRIMYDKLKSLSKVVFQSGDTKILKVNN